LLRPCPRACPRREPIASRHRKALLQEAWRMTAGRRLVLVGIADSTLRPSSLRLKQHRRLSVGWLLCRRVPPSSCPGMYTCALIFLPIPRRLFVYDFKNLHQKTRGSEKETGGSAVDGDGGRRCTAGQMRDQKHHITSHEIWLESETHHFCGKNIIFDPMTAHEIRRLCSASRSRLCGCVLQAPLAARGTRWPIQAHNIN